MNSLTIGICGAVVHVKNHHFRKRGKKVRLGRRCYEVIPSYREIRNEGANSHYLYIA